MLPDEEQQSQAASHCCVFRAIMALEKQSVVCFVNE